MRGLYGKIAGADAVIVASPVYFGTVTAQLKAMIDRFHAVWIAKRRSRAAGRRTAGRRKGYFLCAAGAPERKCFAAARSVVKNFFATADIEYSGGLFCGGLDSAGSIADYAKAMDKAFLIGKASVS
jgi:multimeric flavodoxin WrbA